MNKKIANRLLMAIISIGALAIAFIYLNYSGHPSVGMIQVSRGDVVEGISLSGTVRSQKQADLGFGSAFPATITKLFTKAGDSVKAGAMIAQSENADVQAQYDQVLASVSSARLLLDELNASVKMEKLKLKGLSSNAKKVQKAQVTVTEKSVVVQEATLLGVQAGLRNALAQLQKTIIRAPFDGIVAKQNVEVGDVVAPGVPVATFITGKDIFEIQSFVSEQDVTKIKVGDTADVTFDAYGNSAIFSAQVVAIDPGETTKNGVPTYKVTCVFSGNDDRIKSGMTVNILFKTSKKENVVRVPSTSIISRDGKQLVLVSENGTGQEKEIITGITGVDGMVEIVSGLSEGEYIAK